MSISGVMFRTLVQTVRHWVVDNTVVLVFDTVTPITWLGRLNVSSQVGSLSMR